MKRLSTLLCLSLVVAMLPVQAGAEERQRPIELAQVEYDIYFDDRGRRWLVDPYTGEIVGRARRFRDFQPGEETRRRRAWQDQLARRERRRRAIEQELNDQFGLEERRPRRRDRIGRWLDEYQQDDRRDRRRPRRLDELLEERAYEDDSRQPTPPPRPRIEAEPLPAPETREGDAIAALPQQETEAVESSRAIRRIAKPNFNRSQMAALQIVLDRDGFSPGVIDGQWGSNMANALASWQEAKGAKLSTQAALAEAVTRTGGDVLTSYTITDEDVRGPYVARIPIDYARKAQLSHMSYTSVLEMLAERFHMSEGYLKQLNPDRDFTVAGTEITVVKPGKPLTRKVHYLVADKEAEQLLAYDRNGGLVAAYPATIGSAATPSPSGTHSIERIALDPNYTYNPKINFQQGSNDKVLTIPPGPNGPVGSVWIALSKPTYGIHGTPDPSKIGKTNSHGCIRLTNWDARELAKLVSKGVTVEFRG